MPGKPGKIGVWLGTVAIIENSRFLAHYFMPYLHEAGLAAQVFKVYMRDTPFPARRFSAYIFTGDFHNVSSGLREYHKREEEFLSGLEDCRIYGSCFSHQLIARMRGGTVEGRGSRLLGWEKVDRVEPHPVMSTLDSFNALMMNSDEVTRPPADARLVGTSDECRYQLLAYGDEILTCQAHPEMVLKRFSTTISLGCLALAGGPGRKYKEFRESRSLGEEGSDEAFMRNVVEWLAEASV